MALASIPTRSSATVSGCARRVERTATASVLVLDDGGRVPVAARPDADGADRTRRVVNHVVSVRFEGPLDGPRARLRGVGNRLPVDLTIPLATALALVEAGVPAIVRLTGAVDG